MTKENLTPELREKLSTFLEIERWHRAFLNAYATHCGSLSHRCWEAAFNEVLLSGEECRIYKELYSLGEPSLESENVEAGDQAV